MASPFGLVGRDALLAAQHVGLRVGASWLSTSPGALMSGSPGYFRTEGVLAAEEILRGRLDGGDVAVDHLGESHGHLVEGGEPGGDGSPARLPRDELVELAATSAGSGAPAGRSWRARYTLSPNFAQWAVLAMSTGFSPRTFWATR